MFTPLGTPRPLPYPLKDQVTNGNITDDLGLVPNDFIWPEDPEERTIIPFLFSQREFTAVLSAVDVGADIAYPEQYIEVYWLMVRSLRYQMSICSQIIDCVTNDVDVQQAIAQMLINNQTFNNYLDTQIRALQPTIITEKIITGDCDNSNVFGRVKAIVDHMNKANTDWFEKIEVGTNDEEKFAAVLEGIPILGELPIGDVVEFGQDILEDFAENYDAQIDSDLLNEWYCGLYCIAQGNEDCSLSYGDIFDYFQQRAASNLTLGSAAQDVINFIRFGDFAGGTKIADGMMALQAGLTRVGGNFSGMSLPTIQYATRDAIPSSGWEDCEECPETDYWLVPVMGPEESLEFVSEDLEDGTQTWLMRTYYTGHYLTGGALTANGQGFFIQSVDYNPVATGTGARFVLDFGTYTLDTVPCEHGTGKIWIYNSIAGAEITIVISRDACSDGEWTATTGDVTSVEGDVTTFAPALEGAGWVVDAVFTTGRGLDMTSTGYIDFEEYPTGWWWWDENNIERDGTVVSPGIMTRVRFEFENEVPVVIGGGVAVDV